MTRLAVVGLLALAAIGWFVGTSYLQARRPIVLLLRGSLCFVDYEPLPCANVLAYVGRQVRSPKFVGVTVLSEPGVEGDANVLAAELRTAGYRIHGGILKVGRIALPDARGARRKHQAS